MFFFLSFYHSISIYIKKFIFSPCSFSTCDNSFDDLTFRIEGTPVQKGTSCSTSKLYMQDFDFLNVGVLLYMTKLSNVTVTGTVESCFSETQKRFHLTNTPS